MRTTHFDLEQKDLRILVQSLENCLRTCETRKQDPDAPCEDCDAARTLKAKLEKAIQA
jgi:hypothetical protein